MKRFEDVKTYNNIAVLLWSLLIRILKPYWFLIFLFDIKDRPNNEEKAKHFNLSFVTHLPIYDQQNSITFQSISQLFINFVPNLL